MQAQAPGAEPTNWGAAFGGPAWEYDETTGEYYLHLFSTKQPDLNWENPEVREAVYAMMREWLDRGVDGFRMDVINYISKDPALPDGEQQMGVAYGNGSSAYLNGPRIHEFLHEMHQQVFAGRDRLLTVGEMPGVTVDQAILYTDPAREEVDMVFQFDHVSADRGADPWAMIPLRLTTLKAIFGRWQAGLADVGWNSLYWNNHDQPRVVSRYGDDGAYRVESAKMLAAVLHLHRGTPYVYQGEELGMTNAPFAGIADFRDIEAIGQYAQAVELEGRSPEDVLAVLRARGRDNARTPMQWDDSPHAGFTTGTPWLAVNPNHTEINAAAAAADPDSVYHWYRRLIELRHTEPAVVDGDFTMLLPQDERLYAFTRRLGDTELLVIGNFTAEPVKAEIDDSWAGAELVLTNTTAPQDLVLGPWQVVVHRRTVSP
jgi:oligo-1,6-glucosidase